MSSILFKDLPNLIADDEDDRLFYANLANQVGPRPQGAEIDRIKPEWRDNLAATDPTASFGDETPAGFEPIKEAAKPSGFVPISETKSTTAGFEPIKAVDSGFEPIKAQKEQGPFEKTLGINKDVMSEYKNVAQELINMGVNIPGQVAGWARGVFGEAFGEPPNVANQQLQDFQQKYGNFAPAGQPSAPTTMDAAFSKMGDVASTPFQPGGSLENPVAASIASQAAPYALGYRRQGAKPPGSYIDGEFSRLPDNLLPGPKTADALKAQDASVQAANQRLTELYNQNPLAYGVDESARINPYTSGVGKELNPQIDRSMPIGMEQDVVDNNSFNPYFKDGNLLNEPSVEHDPKTGYMVLNDAFHLQEAVEKPTVQEPQNVGPGPSEAREIPTSERLAAMRSLGDKVIQQIEQDGLSTQQVADQFWNTTYKELPAEVKQRFDLLKEKAESRAGILGVSSKPSDLSGMARWYVALMHEANNYAWGPQSQSALENAQDIKQINGPQDPEVKGWGSVEPENPFFKNQLAGMLFDHAFRMQGNGGSMNKVLTSIENSAKDPEVRTWARLLNWEEHGMDMVLNIKDQSEALRPTVKGSSNHRPGLPPEITIYLKPGEAVDPNTIIHEALHGRTQVIFEIGRDSHTRKQYPAIARMYDELSDLIVATMKAVPDEVKNVYKYAFTHGNMEKFGSLGHEFSAYGISSPAFMQLLKDVTITPDGKTGYFELTRHAFRLLGNEHPAFENIPLKEREAASLKVAKKIELDDAKSTSAFKELTNLLQPILKAYAGHRFHPLTEQHIFDYERDWLDNGQVFGPPKITSIADLDEMDSQMDEDSDKVTTLITKPLRDFHKGFAGSVREKAQQMQAKVQEWEDSGAPKFQRGERIKSPKTGKVYTITGYNHSDKHGFMYRYKTVDGEEGNFIDSKMTPEAFTKMSGPRPAEMKKDDLPNKKVIHKMISPYTSLYDLFKDFMTPEEFQKFVDTGISANIFPTTTAKNIIGNPLFTFNVMRVREVNGAAHALLLSLMNAIKPYREAPVAVKNRINVAMSQLQRPEVQDVLAMSRMQQYGPKWYQNEKALPITAQEATQYGMQPDDYKLYEQTLEPLFHTLWKIDKAMLKHFSRAPESKVVGYFPRSFGYGGFVVQGLQKDPKTGQYVIRAYRRVTSWKEAATLGKIWSNELGLKVERQQSKDFASFVDLLLALVEIDPNDRMAKDAESKLARLEEHKRTQEFERSARNVIGWIGENINNPKELQQLEYTIYTRIRATVDLYKAKRLAMEIARPMRSNPMLRRFWPNAVKHSMDMVRRDLGGDISALKSADSVFQWTLESAYKGYLYTFPTTRELLKDLQPTVSTAGKRGSRPKQYTKEEVLSKDAHRLFAKSAAAFGSGYALIGNIPNMLTNGMSMPLVSLIGGMVDTFILDKDPVKRAQGYAMAIAAQIISTKDLVQFIKTGGKGISDPQVQNIMDEFALRGFLEPAQFSDVTQLKQNYEKSALVRGTAKAFSKPKEMMNDPIERWTNIVAFLYYNRLIRMMHPSLSKNSHMKMVLEFVKNYTGDYGPWNRAMMFDKLGDAGRLANNFTIWAGTRAGQGVFLTKSIGEGGASALVSLMASMIAIGGIEGLPGTSDYENLRNGLHRLFPNGSMDLPPLDKVLKDNNVPYMLRKGLINSLTGFDVASRLKWSGLTDQSTVTYTLPVKAYDLFNYFYSILTPDGASVEDTSNAVNALPQMAHGPAQEFGLTDNLSTKGVNIHNKFGKTMFTQENMKDVIANNFGFKSAKQSEDMQDTYNEHYELIKLAKQEKKLEQQAIERSVDAVESASNGNKEGAERYARQADKAINEYVQIHEGDMSGFNKRVTDAILNRTLTPQERREYELSQFARTPAKLKIIEKIIKSAKSSGP